MSKPKNGACHPPLVLYKVTKPPFYRESSKAEKEKKERKGEESITTLEASRINLQLTLTSLLFNRKPLLGSISILVRSVSGPASVGPWSLRLVLLYFF
ncbi:hypothetical protein VIGAN_04203700, partial [Vigna angularis var. angularis]